MSADSGRAGGEAATAARSAGSSGSPGIEVDAAVAAYLSGEIALPTNPTHEIGDGDFKAIGAEFLRAFVAHCGLGPFDEVLDIGCGFGRMALPLAHYLSPGARYVGFDIVREPVDWCRCNVTPRYPHFEFAHVDFHHPLYNPRGAVPGTEGFRYHLPALQGWRPTFVAAVSVFTHLERATMERFLADVRAVLAPGGRMFLTAFLTGADTPEPTESGVFPQSAWTAHGPLTGLIGDPLTAAVGVSRRWLFEVLAANGLSAESVSFGHWRRGHDPETPFQDVIVVWLASDGAPAIRAAWRHRLSRTASTMAAPQDSESRLTRFDAED